MARILVFNNKTWKNVFNIGKCYFKISRFTNQLCIIEHNFRFRKHITIYEYTNQIEFPWKRYYMQVTLSLNKK